MAKDLQTLVLQPRQLLAAEGAMRPHAREQLAVQAQQALAQQLQHIKHLATTVHTLQPENTLARGFAVARRTAKPSEMPRRSPSTTPFPCNFTAAPRT